MRKLMIAALALALVAPSVSAQVFTEPPRALCSNPYVVRQGDSLWRIAQGEWNNAPLWRRLQELNPFLRDPSRVTQGNNGWVYVMIQPGELLCGVNQNGRVSADVLNGNIVTGTSLNAPVVQEKTFIQSIGDFITQNWLWLLALLAGVGLAALFWLFRQTKKDPVHSGPAMVQGGVTDASVRQQFEQRAFRQNFTILDTVRGRASGILMVSYANGQSHPRQLNNEPAYRATVRHLDGRIEDLYMLQGCGNDLRYGGIWRYIPGNNFRFEVEENIPEAPPVAEEVPAPQPAVTPTSSVFDGEIAPGMIRGHVQGPRSEGDTAVLEIEGASLDGLSFVLVDRKLKIRWIPDATE